MKLIPVNEPQIRRKQRSKLSSLQISNPYSSLSFWGINLIYFRNVRNMYDQNTGDENFTISMYLAWSLQKDDFKAFILHVCKYLLLRHFKKTHSLYETDK